MFTRQGTIRYTNHGPFGASVTLPGSHVLDGPFRMENPAMTTQERRAEALTRACTGQTLSNYPAIFQGFTAIGIPEQDIRPRENVFTYEAWKASADTFARDNMESRW